MLVQLLLPAPQLHGMAGADDQSRADQSLTDPQSAAATGPDDPAAEFYGLDYSDDDGDGDGGRGAWCVIVMAVLVVVVMVGVV